MSVNFDASEVRQFAADLTRAGMKVAQGVPPIVVKAAVNIKKQLSAEMASSASFGALSGMSFDLDPDRFGAEIGPKKGSGGAAKLGFGYNIAYFGGSNGGGGTVPDPSGALKAEVPNFIKALADLAEGSF